jgi:DNA-binding response OmpR family regulator
MPGMEGWEVCRRLKAQRNVPIMMLTVRAEKEDVARGIALGADEYMAKPFDIPQFVERLKQMLARRRT